MHMWTKTRVDARVTRVPTRKTVPAVRAPSRRLVLRALARRGNGENSTTILLGEGYVCFPQLAPIPMSDILRLRLLGRRRMNLCPFSCAPTRLDARHTHAC